jgi:glutamate synthase domain-containing protein 2
MFALGCVQALQCNKNTCPTGITTHDPDLQRGLNPEDKAARVASYARNLTHEVEIIAHSCGVAEPGLLDRSHAQIINEDGLPEPLTRHYPPAETRPEFQVQRIRASSS